MEKKSYWQEETKNFEFEKQPFVKPDVLIIGGGMVGIMTAYELSQTSNLKIVLVTKDKIASDVSAKTNGKITPMHNLMYQDIKSSHGIEKAKQYYDSQVEAMNYIIQVIKKEKIDCHLVKEKNYMYATSEEGLKKLEKEINVLKEMNIPFHIINKLPLDTSCKKAIQYDENYLFHPIKYLNKIIDILKNNENVDILENYQAIDYQYNNEYTVFFNNGQSLTAPKVVVATHYPIFNFEGLYAGKLYQEKSYLVSFQSKKAINGMYINTDQPVISMRYDQDTIILLGNSHICGKKVDEEKRLQEIEKEVYYFDKEAKITNTWTNQDVISIDFLPFIGQYSRSTPNLYVATAFETWGMTNSHVAALLLAREILTKPNPYRGLYDPSRFSHIRSMTESIKMMGRATNGLILSRIAIKTISLEQLKENQGAVVSYKNKRYGGYNTGEEYLLVKPTCTHTYCFLQWNNQEKTWDCKCHGSRFDIYGKVLQGPATKDLELIRIKKDNLI